MVKALDCREQGGRPSRKIIRRDNNQNSGIVSPYTRRAEIVTVEGGGGGGKKSMSIDVSGDKESHSGKARVKDAALRILAIASISKRGNQVKFGSLNRT